MAYKNYGAKLMEFFTNHNTFETEFINCPKYKMHICIEQTDSDLIRGSDVPRFEIIWHIHGESNPRSRTMDILNLVAPDPETSIIIPHNVYDAIMETYGDKLKILFNNYYKEKGYKFDN